MEYQFKNRKLYEEALTSPACRMDHPGIRDNQRLEFLGDAVLGILAAEKLYAEFPEVDEGRLTVLKTHLVSTAALCDAAARTGIVRQIRRNRGAAPLPRDSKTIADAVEAMIGAAYLDGGYTAAEQVFKELDLQADAHGAIWSENPKGDLQIYSQSLNPPRRPVYELLKKEGKAHAPIFTIRVIVEGLGEAVGRAGSRRQAETLAAQLLLERYYQRPVS